MGEWQFRRGSENAGAVWTALANWGTPRGETLVEEGPAEVLAGHARGRDDALAGLRVRAATAVVRFQLNRQPVNDLLAAQTVGGAPGRNYCRPVRHVPGPLDQAAGEQARRQDYDVTGEHSRVDRVEDEPFAWTSRRVGSRGARATAR